MTHRIPLIAMPVRFAAGLLLIACVAACQHGPEHDRAKPGDEGIEDLQGFYREWEMLTRERAAKAEHHLLAPLSPEERAVVLRGLLEASHLGTEPATRVAAISGVCQDEPELTRIASVWLAKLDPDSLTEVEKERALACLLARIDQGVPVAHDFAALARVGGARGEERLLELLHAGIARNHDRPGGSRELASGAIDGLLRLRDGAADPPWAALIDIAADDGDQAATRVRGRVRGRLIERLAERGCDDIPAEKEERQQLIELLEAQLGGANAIAIVKGLGDAQRPCPELAAAVARSLASLNQEPRSLGYDILARMEGKDVVAAAILARLMEERPRADGLEALANMVELPSDPSLEVVREAVMPLFLRPDPKAYSSSDPKRLARAMLMLGMEPSLVARELRPALRTPPDIILRTDAIRLLGYVGPPTRETADELVATACEAGLTTIERRSHDLALGDALRVLIERGVADALGALQACPGDPEFLDAVREMAASPPPAVLLEIWRYEAAARAGGHTLLASHGPFAPEDPADSDEP